MSNLDILAYEQAPPSSQEILDSLRKKIGKVPNIFWAVAHSPVALKGFLTYKEILGKGEFSAKEVEAIDLAVSQVNGCDYCLAAHTAIAKAKGFSEEDTLDLRKANIADPKLKALTFLAKEIVETKGRPGQEAIDGFYAAGYSKGALVELIANISKNIFTNYFNHIAETEMDFPPAKPLDS